MYYANIMHTGILWEVTAFSFSSRFHLCSFCTPTYRSYVFRQPLTVTGASWRKPPPATLQNIERRGGRVTSTRRRSTQGQKKSWREWEKERERERERRNVETVGTISMLSPKGSLVLLFFLEFVESAEGGFFFTKYIALCTAVSYSICAYVDAHWCRFL